VVNCQLERCLLGKEVGAFLGGELFEQGADPVPGGVNDSIGGLRRSALSFEVAFFIGLKSGLQGGR
jgi:hypothetical protein